MKILRVVKLHLLKSQQLIFLQGRAKFLQDLAKNRHGGEQGEQREQAKVQPPPQAQSHPQDELSPEQKRQIASYHSNPQFNELFNIPKNSNLQKELIVAQKSYQRSTRDLRNAILFQDLLLSQKQILIYDTEWKPYTHHVLGWIGNLVLIAGGFFGLWLLAKQDKKNKVILERTSDGKVLKAAVCAMAAFLLAYRTLLYWRFYRRFVSKIVYSTEKQEFTFYKRNFFFRLRTPKVSRFKLVYTQNEKLNKWGTNYFDVDSLQQFSIGYRSAWKKQELFSHLISQRIKL